MEASVKVNVSRESLLNYRVNVIDALQGIKSRDLYILEVINHLTFQGDVIIEHDKFTDLVFGVMKREFMDDRFGEYSTNVELEFLDNAEIGFSSDLIIAKVGGKSIAEFETSEYPNREQAREILGKFLDNDGDTFIYENEEDELSAHSEPTEPTIDK